jgi:Domain of unknown function (DUF4149)
VSAMPTVLRSALWILLGGWVGAWGLFSLRVAPVAFSALPPDQAGHIVAPVLAALHLYGIGAGLALAGLAALLRRGRLLVGLPLALALLCGVSEFGVSAAIHAVRPHAFGPGADAADAARFAWLHRVSVAIFTVVWLGALALVGLHARADAPARNPREDGDFS